MTNFILWYLEKLQFAFYFLKFREELEMLNVFQMLLWKKTINIGFSSKDQGITGTNFCILDMNSVYVNKNCFR